MAMNVNITTTRTAYDFRVVDGNYEYTGTYQAGDGTGMSREANGSVTLVRPVDSSMESMNMHIGNFNFNRPYTSPVDKQSFININCNVEESYFIEVYAAIPEVIKAVEAKIVD
jgi:hypothetical protein